MQHVSSILREFVIRYALDTIYSHIFFLSRDIWQFTIQENQQKQSTCLQRFGGHQNCQNDFKDISGRSEEQDKLGFEI